MSVPVLLSRNAFRERVFARDQHKCVICGEPAQDAHHILERKLWPDGGYYLENGASVCGKHHIECEQTLISVEDVRHAAGITRVLVPPHIYDDQQIDKWGNPVLANGQRMRGELFYDESVQKILTEGDVLRLFTNRVKHARTYHVAWSENIHDDDRVIPSMKGFEGKRVIVSKKMDGENTTMYRDYFHARSIDSPNHPSRNWVKNFWGQICGDIPEGFRVSGENLFAQHSIAYDDLPSYFLGFSIWNDRNVCLSWDETLEWFALMGPGITPVPVIYDGLYDEKAIRALWDSMAWEKDEGYVIRVANEFAYADFKWSVAKFVRKDHVMTQKHWMRGQAIIPNKLMSAS